MDVIETGAPRPPWPRRRMIGTAILAAVVVGVSLYALRQRPTPTTDPGAAVIAASKGGNGAAAVDVGIVAPDLVERAQDSLRAGDWDAYHHWRILIGDRYANGARTQVVAHTETTEAGVYRFEAVCVGQGEVELSWTSDQVTPRAASAFLTLICDEQETRAVTEIQLDPAPLMTIETTADTVAALAYWFRRT